MNAPRLIAAGFILLGLLLFGTGIYLLVSSASKEPPPAAQLSNSAPPPAQATPYVKPTPININKTMTVPAQVMWFDTGIDVPTGAAVKISYRSGHWTNVSDSNFCDGEGKQFERREQLIVPSSELAALVGKVGDNGSHTGDNYRGKPGGGRLFLSLNDIAGTYDDNRGSLEVSVSVK